MLPIEKLIISPLFLISIIIVVAFIGWLLAVKLFTPNRKIWRRLNFLGICFSCLGIVGVVKDSRQILYERESFKYQQRIEGAYRWRIVSNLNEDLYYREFVTTEYGPKNLGQIQEDFDTTYQWIKDNKEYIFKCYKNQKPICVLP